jgi:hypothetical protein
MSALKRLNPKGNPLSRAETQRTAKTIKIEGKNLDANADKSGCTQIKPLPHQSKA